MLGFCLASKAATRLAGYEIRFLKNAEGRGEGTHSPFPIQIISRYPGRPPVDNSLWSSFISPCSLIQLTKQRVWIRGQDLPRTVSGERDDELLSEPKRAVRKLRDAFLLTLCSSDLEAGKRVLLDGSFVFSPPLFVSVPSALTSYSSEVVTTWRHWQEKILYRQET